MKISDILRHKGEGVVTANPAESVTDLVAKLAEHNVGALVVVDDSGETVVGIVSERDIVRRLNKQGTALLEAKVGDIMTTGVFTCTPQDNVDKIAGDMTEKRIRHMPVCQNDKLIGIVTIGDVVSSRMRQLEQDSRQLEQYITG